MKNSLKVLLLSFMLALPLAANAADAVKSQSTDSADKSAQATQSAPNVAEFDKQMAQIRDNMQKMQEQMAKLQQTQDPQERQKLLQDHWTTMQTAMQTMHGMWGPGGCMNGMMYGPMMGGMMNGSMMGGRMMGWNDMNGYYTKLTPEQMKQRQYMMDQYTGMQQIMMDNMMQHQNWMMQPAR